MTKTKTRHNFGFGFGPTLRYPLRVPVSLSQKKIKVLRPSLTEVKNCFETKKISIFVPATGFKPIRWPMLKKVSFVHELFPDQNLES